MILPSILALYYGEMKALQAFVLTLAITSAVCGTYVLLTRNHKKSTFTIKDGFLFVSLSWVCVSLIGSLPAYISGIIPSFTDSFFETMSGITTTGSTILTNIEVLPKSILFWRALTHWLGGMGIVVLTVAVFPILGIGGLELIKAEVPGPNVDKLTPRITGTAKILWFIYIGFTVLETVLLMFGGMTWFDAITQSFATISTGGLSTKNASIGFFNSAYIDWVVMVFMFLSGINFALHFRLISGKSLIVLRDTELKVYISILVISTLLIAYNLYESSIYSSIEECLRYAGFHVTSIMTTTGFSSVNYESWPYFSQIILFTMLFVGACSGSTGGGIKVIRLVTLFKQALNEMKLLLHPRGVFVLKLNGKAIEKNIVYAIAGFFFLYMTIVLIITVIIASSGEDIFTSFTAALATLGCVGPAFGKVGPHANYAFFEDYVKWTLSVAMLIGRLELYTILILFTPGFWRK